MHHYGARTDYGRLLADVERLAGWLAAAGVRRDDRVIVDLQNSPQFVIAFYAILRANAVVVPVNPMNTTAEIAYVAGDSGARAAILGEELLDRFRPLAGEAFETLLRVRYADMAGAEPSQHLQDVMSALRRPAEPGFVEFEDALGQDLSPPRVSAGPEDLAILVDRIKRMINVSGYKVWPAECEMLLYRHPAVAECAVIAAPDPRTGETVRAVIVLRPEHQGKVTGDDIIAFARTLMAAYKVPREVEFREALPRSGTRKVDWRALQAEVRAEAG